MTEKQAGWDKISQSKTNKFFKLLEKISSGLSEMIVQDVDKINKLGSLLEQKERLGRIK